MTVQQYAAFVASAIKGQDAETVSPPPFRSTFDGSMRLMR